VLIGIVTTMAITGRSVCSVNNYCDMRRYMCSANNYCDKNG
jgi:hypothetical protein